MKGNNRENQENVERKEDKMADRQLQEEALARELNVDDSRSGMSQLEEEPDPTAPEEDYKSQWEEVNDKYLRLVAEFDNFRKRTAKERTELILTASRDLMTGLLEVLDDMDRAEELMVQAEETREVREGTMLIFSKLRSVLQSRGLRKMESRGEEFNPDFHEAISEMPASDEKLKGHVIEVVQNGYFLNDKLIRHARVVVGK